MRGANGDRKKTLYYIWAKKSRRIMSRMCLRVGHAGTCWHWLSCLERERDRTKYVSIKQTTHHHDEWAISAYGFFPDVAWGWNVQQKAMRTIARAYMLSDPESQLDCSAVGPWGSFMALQYKTVVNTWDNGNQANVTLVPQCEHVIGCHFRPAPLNNS